MPHSSNRRPGIYFGRFCFAPRFFPLLVTLILLPLLLWLGFWQLNRAAQKQRFQAEYHAMQEASPIDLKTIAEPYDQYRYQRMELNGEFDNQHQFLLDNRTFMHRVGYVVLTPFKPKGYERAVLVNRGWIPMGKSRADLPTIEPIKGSIHLEGTVTFPLLTHFTLKKTELVEHWPLRIQMINIEKLQGILKYKLYPFVIVLDAKNQYTFVRTWAPEKLQPERNKAYALQWFGLALALFVIFIVVNIRRYREE